MWMRCADAEKVGLSNWAKGITSLVSHSIFSFVKNRIIHRQQRQNPAERRFPSDYFLRLPSTPFQLTGYNNTILYMRLCVYVYYYMSYLNAKSSVLLVVQSSIEWGGWTGKRKKKKRNLIFPFLFLESFVSCVLYMLVSLCDIDCYTPRHISVRREINFLFQLGFPSLFFFFFHFKNIRFPQEIKSISFHLFTFHQIGRQVTTVKIRAKCVSSSYV